MSSGKRKLSFLGFAPQEVAGEDDLRLDEEMDRVVWAEGAGTPPRAPTSGEPRRDDAAPPPYTQRTHASGTEGLTSASSGELSPASAAPATSESEPQISGWSGSGSGGGSAHDDDKHVQFGGRAEQLELPEDTDDERRSQRNA